MLKRRASCTANRERPVVPWLRLIIFCSSLLLWGSPALARTVVLLGPPVHSPNTTELLQRLRGELLSVGFEVAVRDRPTESAGSEPWRQSIAAKGEVDAAVDLVGEVTPLAVDVWIVDRTHQFQLVARVTLDTNTDNVNKRLAIRASEVLRAHLFETQVTPADKPAPGTALSPAATAIEAETESSLHSRHLGFELGAAALFSLDGVGPALLPMVRFDWALTPELVLEATLSGLGTRPSVATAAGSAQVATQYGLVGACYRLDWGHRLRPLGALSFGALRTAVVGRADLPREGHSVDQWSFLLDASLGAAFELSRHYSVVLAGHAQFAQPYVALRFGDQQVASSGRPNLLISLTFGAWP